MRVHHLDAAVVELPFGQTKAIHQPCSALLWDAVIEANDNVAAHPELIEDDPADEA
jgi:glycine cleavage system H lipoate-binding protein